jgi:hypothetical protein
MQITTLLTTGAVGLCIALMPCAKAQDLKVGAKEIAGFGGVVHARGRGASATNMVAGGNFGYAVTKNIWAIGEFSYAPLGDFQYHQQDMPGATIRMDTTSRLYSFDAGIHYNLPTSSSRVVPYVALGAGLGDISSSGRVTVRVGHLTSTTNFQTGNTGINLGAGLGMRYYVSDTWGIRPEVRLSRLMAGGGGVTALRFTVGVFYQFGK